MVKRRKKKWRMRFEHGLEEETIHTVLAVIFFALGIFLSLAVLSKAGIVGEKLYDGLKLLLGVGYFLLPALAFVLGISYLLSMKAHLALTKTIGSLIFFLSGLGVIDILFTEKGGLIGGWISKPLLVFFDLYAALIILIALFLISLLVLFNTRPSFDTLFDTLRFWRKREEEAMDLQNAEEYEEEEEEDQKEASPSKLRGAFSLKKPPAAEYDELPALPISKYTGSTYTPPPLSLLSKDKGKPGVGDIKANANIIKRTMQNFGIKVEVDEVSIGPSVTRYALKPAEGVRLSKIVGLQKNLELALAAHPVRIEAPIPGKSLVGIEVPNTAKTLVGLATLLSSREYTSSSQPLLFSLGRGVSGESLFSNLAQLPHLLIAGATGAGKSVMIHTLITSLMFKNSPEDVKFVMVDPKRVELTLYKGIPHLLTPVITDAKKTILALKWLTNEMERRYDILETESVRDIQSYHTNILAPAFAKAKAGKASEEIDYERLPETMPYIILVIDELADIMSTYPRELEASIVRLAQMSRAVGIHLVLSTQRPSVNVITGLIKANIPGRVALQVSSQIDSRTILDMSGAEKLLGAGDMLFLSGEMSKPKRLQSAFITEVEVKKVVGYLKRNYDEDIESDMELALEDETENVTIGSTFDDDELYEEALETVVHAGKASTSYLQRKLRVGYARAARLMDMLEERGIIGKADGSKPREILTEGETNTGSEEDDEY